MNIHVYLRKLDPAARLPNQRVGDVGFDLFCLTETVIPARSVGRVPTGIAFADDVSYSATFKSVPFFKIEGRSSLALKGYYPIGGIIDPSYRGEIVGIMTNMTDAPWVIKPGEKFAQLVCYLTYARTPEISVRLNEVSEAKETVRGTNGFGSTGA
jgi:dUTP pyrophosphatase